MFQNILTLIDPATYGLNRSATALGICVAGVLIYAGTALLEVLHRMGLPSAG